MMGSELKTSVIYRPTGRALEYSFLALNPWGFSCCSHDCTYCYVPGMAHMTREQWKQQPFQPRKNLVKLLRQDCEKLRGTNERVLCCFAGDLYSPEAVAIGLPRQILETFREFDVPFQVLTKGGMRAVADFDLYGPKDVFAVTLTCIRHYDEDQCESGAASYLSRVEALMYAHDRSIRTWASCEPVLNPNATLDLIEYAAPWCDLFKIGKLNHDALREKTIDWTNFAWDTMTLCNKLGKPFIFKEDLRAFCDFEIVGECKDDPRVVKR